MINCFLDPIFLAVNDSISSKHYSEVLYPILLQFSERIKEIEDQTHEREIEFNISFELILESMEFNPFRFSRHVLCRDWFRRFLSNFLKIHRNTNCDIVTMNHECQINQISYINANVPNEIMENWNLFLNSCSESNCCSRKKLDLVSCMNLGCELSVGSTPFFNNIIYDLISWVESEIEEIETIVNPPEIQLEPKLKKKGDWSHSHPKLVMNDVDKLLNCRHIREVRSIKKTRRVNKNYIQIMNFDQYQIFIKDRNGAHIFLINTTARNDREGSMILEEISNLLNSYEIKS